MDHRPEMADLTANLRADHARLELRLDELLAAIRPGAEDLAAIFRAAAEAAGAHYRKEEEFLDRLARAAPSVAGKMKAQHAEAREIAAGFEEALAAGHAADALALARRFHAIAQHNIIEEERDVFPLAERLGG
jgi:hypothetical protein